MTPCDLTARDDVPPYLAVGWENTLISIYGLYAECREQA
jgi:hypothetical protein